MIDGTITDSMELHFSDFSAERLIHWAQSEFENNLAITTSFGIQSAVTLHLATQIKPDIKVIWIDTGYLPEETYQYALTLTRLMDLKLQVYESPMSPEEMEATHGRLWESDDVNDLNRYDRIRKVEPLQRALAENQVHGWISGLRAEQTEFRKRLPRVKRSCNRYRLYPILKWNSKDVYQYMQQHKLPQHPLFHQGYTTVGDRHSSRPLTASDTNERDTRFKGLKQECGLHL